MFGLFNTHSLAQAALLTIARQPVAAPRQHIEFLEAPEGSGCPRGRQMNHAPFVKTV